MKVKKTLLLCIILVLAGLFAIMPFLAGTINKADAEIQIKKPRTITLIGEIRGYEIYMFRNTSMDKCYVIIPPLRSSLSGKITGTASIACD